MRLWFWEPFIISLLLTIVLEEAFALVIGIRKKEDLLLLALVNVLTNPVVVLLYYICEFYTTWNSLFVTAILEMAAVVTEAHYFKSYGKGFRRPYLFAVCVNIFSYGIGKIINSL